jgi:hypothetical protein
MGSIVSTVLFQPLLLGAATALMIIALLYQDKKSRCGDKIDNWGKEIFKLEMGVAIVIIIAAIFINFISGLEI